MNQIVFLRLTALLLASFTATTACFADARLPGFFTDHMVLQQKTPVRVWGWADADETITVAMGQSTVTTQAAADGQWQVELPARQASNQPVTLTIQANNRIELNDILIGEVWLCSGQSNMEWSVRSSTNAKEEIASADHPMIRHVQIPKRPSTMPIEDIAAAWQVCSPETVGGFTAVGYFMARRLNKELNVPIGLIHSSWGGTRIEPWTPPVGFAGVNELSGISESVIGRTPGTTQYQSTLSAHIEATKKWIDSAEASLKLGTETTPSPGYPGSLRPFESHQDPTMLYNGMIHALIRTPIRGAIWYQGESNHNEGSLYTAKMRALIEGWRSQWNQGDFPFYFVQIAPYQYGNESGNVLAEFWEAQAAATAIPNTAMVIINDVATLNDIHPPNKQTVGLRLANVALRNDYAKESIVGLSPQVIQTQIVGDSLQLTFDNTGGGLKTRDGESATWFEIIGPKSGGFQPATAKIKGDQVILTSPAVKNPVAVRFAWDKLAEPNLCGGTGLPVGAFRAGEMPDFVQTVPGSDDYELVYEIDLNSLGDEIRYSVDRHDDIAAFDRIAYHVSLEDGNGDVNEVFVSMDAFTDNVHHIAIPTFESGARFQQTVTSMNVHCSDDRLTGGMEISTGNIEFWPNNYAPANGGGVPNASGTAFDFGDQMNDPVRGYGSMQVHNHGARQTVFAINHWTAGANADIGIGNHSGDNPDWTFARNASQYKSKRLKVFVRSVQ